MLLPGQKRVSFKGHSLLASLAFLLASLVRLPSCLRSWRLQALLQALVVFFRADNCSLMRLEVLGPPLASQLESVDYRFVIVNFRRQHDRLGIWLNEHNGDWCSETRAVESGLARRNVNFIALGTVNFDAARPNLIAHADRKHLLFVAESPGAEAVLGRQISMVEHSHTLKRD